MNGNLLLKRNPEDGLGNIFETFICLLHCEEYDSFGLLQQCYLCYDCLAVILCVGV